MNLEIKIVFNYNYDNENNYILKNLKKINITLIKNILKQNNSTATLSLVYTILLINCF